MGHHWKNPAIMSGLKMTLLAGAASLAFAGAALAQVSQQPSAPLKMQTDYFGYSASASLRMTYSDNINLGGAGFKDGEFALSSLFTGGAIMSTPRFTGIILGDLDFAFLIDSGDFVINQNIGATSTFTGADNWLYLDLSGSTQRQLIGDNARYSSNVVAGRNQRADVHTYAASPYIFHAFADESSLELRYRFSQVFVHDKISPLAFFRGSTINDSTAHEVIARYDSGHASERLHFQLLASGTDTKENGISAFPDFNYKLGTIASNIQFALSSHFSLSGGVGYDELDTTGAASLFFDENALSGFFWRAGFAARPGPKTYIRLEYGERYGDDFIDADVSYKLSNRLRFTAAASRSFRTRAQSTSSQTGTTGRQTLAFADALRQGAELSAREIIDSANWYASTLNFGQAQTSGVSVSDHASAALTGDFDRTKLSLNGYYADDDFGFRQIKTYGGGVNLRREISRKIEGYSSVTYRHADTTFDSATCEANPLIFGFDAYDPMFDPIVACMDLAGVNGVTDTVIGRIGGSYNLYENASIFVQVAHTERFAHNPQLEYAESNFVAGVTLDF